MNGSKEGGRIPPPQRLLWPELRSTSSGFVLCGDTALALRLAHRESEDFDFFSPDPLDAERLLADVPYLDHAEVVRNDPYAQGPDLL